MSEAHATHYLWGTLAAIWDVCRSRNTPPPAFGAAFLVSSASEVDMLSPAELGRRITSAQDRLRAARRDGRFEDIVIWRDELDSLLEQYPRTSEGH